MTTTAQPDPFARWRFEVYEDPNIPTLYVGRAIGPDGEVVDHIAGSVIKDDVIPMARRNLARHADARVRQAERRVALDSVGQGWLAQVLSLPPAERIDALLAASSQIMKAAPAEASFLSFINQLLTDMRSALEVPVDQRRVPTQALFRSMSDDAELFESPFGRGVLSMLEVFDPPDPSAT